MKKLIPFVFFLLLVMSVIAVYAGGFNIEGLEGVLLLTSDEETSENRLGDMEVSVTDVSLSLVDDVYFRIDVTVDLTNWGYSTADLHSVRAFLNWMDLYNLEQSIDFSGTEKVDVYKSVSGEIGFLVPYEVALSEAGQLKLKLTSGMESFEEGIALDNALYREMYPDRKYQFRPEAVVSVSGIDLWNKNASVCDVIVDVLIVNWDVTVKEVEKLDGTLTFHDRYKYEGTEYRMYYQGGWRVDDEYTFHQQNQYLQPLELVKRRLVFEVPYIVGTAEADELKLEISYQEESHSVELDPVKVDKKFKVLNQGPFSYEKRKTDSLDYTLKEAVLWYEWDNKYDPKYQWAVQEISLINWGTEAVSLDGKLASMLVYDNTYGFVADVNMDTRILNPLETGTGTLLYHVPADLSVADSEKLEERIRLEGKEWKESCALRESGELKRKLLERYGQHSDSSDEKEKSGGSGGEEEGKGTSLTEAVPENKGEAPVIRLKSNMLTLKVGEQFSPVGQILSITDDKDAQEYLMGKVHLQGYVSRMTSSAGTYVVTYDVTDSDGNTSEIVRMTILVEE